MSTQLIAPLVCLLQLAASWTAAGESSPAATAEWASRAIVVPIQVLTPDDGRPAEQAAISVFALRQDAGHTLRGKQIVRAVTGRKGEPCSVRLAASLQRVLIEARRAGESGSVWGSIMLTFDPDRSLWREQGSLVGRQPRELRPSEVLGERPAQPTISVKIPQRERARVYVIATHYERLPNFAEVMIFAANGKCVRRGFPRGTGEGFDAERDQPLDPRYGRLLVVARGWQNGQLLTGSALLVFDHNNWRPATRYDEFIVEPGKRSGKWLSKTDYDAESGRFEPILDGAMWMPSQIRVPVPAHPLPLWKPGEATEWRAEAEATGTDAPPTPACACCQDKPEAADEDLLKQFGFKKTPLASAEVEELAAREAAIVEAGRPLVPGNRWADFGHRWIYGPSNMVWQAAIENDRP